MEVEGDREGESVGESGLMSMFAEELVEEEEEDVAGEREGTEYEEIEGLRSRQLVISHWMVVVECHKHFMQETV